MIVRLLLIGFCLFVTWIIYLTNTGQSSGIIQIARQVPYGDKAGHVILTGILALLTNLALNCRTIDWGRLKFPLGTLITSVVVVLEEWSQMYIPARTFSKWDLFSDFIGISVFTILAFVIHRYARKK